jgi:BirA family biotin operon repressor/biotin-[acetyl-CoA-carboxylase] ligase
VIETIQTWVDGLVTIKWPNDVLIDEKKVCGILIEQGHATIVGIGLNVKQSAGEFAAMNLRNATSLSLAAHQLISVDSVAKLLIRTLDLEYHAFVAGSITALERRWQHYIGLLGRRVVVERQDGHKLRGELRELSFAGITIEPTGSPWATLAPEEVRHLRAADSPN